MFSSATSWAGAQETPVSIPDTIGVYSVPVNDWTFIALTVAFLGALLYATSWYLDQAIARRQAADEAREWSKLVRTVRSARRELGGHR